LNDIEFPKECYSDSVIVTVQNKIQYLIQMLEIIIATSEYEYIFFYKLLDCYMTCCFSDDGSRIEYIEKCLIQKRKILFESNEEIFLKCMNEEQKKVEGMYYLYQVIQKQYIPRLNS
jgi:hypothetical protein